MISVDEFGLGEGNLVNPNLATIILSSGSNVKLFLNLQRAERETKLAQLSLLQQAFRDEADVTIKFENRPVGGGKSVRVIIGVQLGISTEISPGNNFPT